MRKVEKVSETRLKNPAYRVVYRVLTELLEHIHNKRRNYDSTLIMLHDQIRAATYDSIRQLNSVLEK